ncbi:Fic family protein [Pseudomonas gingeri]|uniref:Fic family protein n=1 Tax=Pseudomonas gingeri TaxID=117681 RepID=UPI00210DE468|nr:Fic family protein [Pseudomonas gingeri]
MRHAVTYQRTFVDNYIPNQSSLLPTSLATTLMEEGRMRGQQPAGTYARKVLEPLLIDLSWSSSRLEGNRYSLLATEELFKSGVTGGDLDAVMLLNHKAAIEFMVDAVPSYGLTTPVIQNLHALLMQDLLADSGGLGTIRQKIVNISDTTYLPSQVPSLLGEMLECILEKARQIKNPVESAFFLWVNLAYLQPFDDGNKRTSRLAANVPLMLYNSAPLSFLDMDVRDYAHAMMGVYEYLDVSLAADLFEWAYRRSIRKYEVTLEAMGRPDPVRVQFREALNEAIGAIVRDRKTCEEAMADLSLDADQAQLLRPLLMDELKVLGVFNCARYRLTMKQTESWIDAGRPL